VARVWGNGGKAIAGHDDSSLEFFLVVELPLSVDKPANHGSCHNGVCAICPVQAPLMRLWVEEPQSNAFDVPRRAASFELEKARAPPQTLLTTEVPS
jgi:hypothetical protein